MLERHGFSIKNGEQIETWSRMLSPFMENFERDRNLLDLPVMSNSRETVAIRQHEFGVERISQVPMGKMDTHRRWHDLNRCERNLLNRAKMSELDANWKVLSWNIGDLEIPESCYCHKEIF